ncbi:hypothetical protein LINPERHAP1_LOCUS19344, partial [Linum perenne]
SYEFGGWESSFWGTRRRLEPRLLFQDLVARESGVVSKLRVDSE